MARFEVLYHSVTHFAMYSDFITNMFANKVHSMWLVTILRTFYMFRPQLTILSGDVLNISGTNAILYNYFT
jgi:hypothetical protein